MAASRFAIALRVAVGAGSLIVAAACGGSPAATGAASPAASAVGASPEASTETTSPSASASASAAASGSASAGGNTIALTAQEYSFSGPASATAGVTTITLQNAGKEEHQAQLVKLNEGKAFSDLTTALATGNPEAALAIVTVSGGPTAVQPGATGQTTQALDAGNYAFLCFISGADGIPHVAKGMIQPLTITGTASDTTLPAGDATVTAKDFSFDVSTPVAAGEHTFTFTNNGPQPHEAGIIKLTGAMTVDQIKGVFTASPAPSGQEPQGPPPWEDAGGSGAIAPGATATFTANLEAGQQYAFICFVPDPATGQPHAALGMITAIPTQ
jgi:plastocyanin